MNKHLEIAGNIHLSYYIAAAEKLGIEYKIVSYGMMARFSNHDKHWFIINTVVPVNNAPSCTIAKRKSLTNRVLKNANINVPAQLEISTEKELNDFYSIYNNKIVVKPKQAIGGHGVTILPREDMLSGSFESAYKASKNSDKIRVLAEEFVVGEHYRVLVLDDNVIGVSNRIPPYVIGDGIKTLNELINSFNEERSIRGLSGIPIDNEVENRIDEQGYTLSDVIEFGKKLNIRYNCNLSTGGKAIEASHRLNPYYKCIAIQAVKEIGLKLGGVDMIIENPASAEGKYWINEINYNPGLRPHYKPDEGDVVEVAVPIMEYIRENL